MGVIRRDILACLCLAPSQSAGGCSGCVSVNTKGREMLHGGTSSSGLEFISRLASRVSAPRVFMVPNFVAIFS